MYKVYYETGRTRSEGWKDNRTEISEDNKTK